MPIFPSLHGSSRQAAPPPTRREPVSRSSSSSSDEEWAARRIQTVIRIRLLKPSVGAFPSDDAKDGQHRASDFTCSRWTVTPTGAVGGSFCTVGTSPTGTVTMPSTFAASDGSLARSSGSGCSDPSRERLDRLLPIAPIRQKSRLPFEAYLRGGRGPPPPGPSPRDHRRGSMLDVGPDAGYCDADCLHDGSLSSSRRFAPAADSSGSDPERVDVGLSPPTRRDSLMSSLLQSSSSLASSCSRRGSLPFPMGLFDPKPSPSVGPFMEVSYNGSMGSPFYMGYNDEDDGGNGTGDDTIRTETKEWSSAASSSALAESNSIHASSVWMSSYSIMMRSMDSVLYNSTAHTDCSIVPADRPGHDVAGPGGIPPQQHHLTTLLRTRGLAASSSWAPPRRGIFSEDRGPPARRRSLLQPLALPARSKSGGGLVRNGRRRGSMHSIDEDLSSLDGERGENRFLTGAKGNQGRPIHDGGNADSASGPSGGRPAVSLTSSGGASHVRPHHHHSPEDARSTMAPSLPRRRASTSTSSGGGGSSIRSTMYESTNDGLNKNHPERETADRSADD